ncbi:PREDICTED: uncharacterized protein LOC109478430 [Branchiostoma belcheri]|uniref:Uncharacterized protein LOC109478430 n=1 Tax=Branchiostoma belcheri TaxID=7741 RepID=A0A6P5A121_BRABE|nr:PREDICTED: uncharacterized protein LOC109478430 [Branchiostoma belcheri]
MGSLSEKHRHLEIQLRTTGNPEAGYRRALRDAIANGDSYMEVEALKCLGDLHLEKGKSSKASEELRKCKTFYTAALLRCKDRDLKETLQHRSRYLEKVAGKLEEKHCITASSREEAQNGDCSSSSSVLRAAETFLALDRLLAGFDVKNLEDEYTKILVTAIATCDRVLEEESLKSLGDLYLEEGKKRLDILLLSKAEGLYNNARGRCEEPEAKEVLSHRYKYAEKVTEEVKLMLCKRGIRGSKFKNTKDRGREVIPIPDAGSDAEDSELLRLYEDRTKKGQSRMESGDLEEAEQDFAEALKLVHGKPTYLELEADCLHRLGNVYKDRGKMTKDGGDFTKAAALYQASLVRTGNEDFKKNSTSSSTQRSSPSYGKQSGYHVIGELAKSA